MHQLKPLLLLRPYIKPYAWMLGFSLFLGIPLSIMRLGPAPLMQRFVDNVLEHGSRKDIIIFPLYVIGLFTLNFVVRFFHYYLNRVVVARVLQRLKYEIYHHLMGLSADYFTASSTGGLISRVGSDPQYIDGGLSSFGTLVREPLTFLACFSYALYLNWKLTIIILLIFPFLAWVFTFSGKALKRYMHRMNTDNANLFGWMQETFSGIRVIKVFQLEKYAKKKFREHINRFTNTSIKTAAVQEASHPAIELLSAFAIAAVLYFGGSEVFNGHMTRGQFFAFGVTFALMLDPIRKLNEVNLKIFQAVSATESVFQILSWKSHIADKENAVSKKTLHREIEIRNLSFAYPDEKNRFVLKDLSFSIPKDNVVALVGQSGSGKSTLAHLIPRLYEVTKGQILIDGIDIRDLKIADLRKLVSVVSQDVFLFNDTIEENIRCGRLSATREEIVWAAKHANALDFIHKLPQGFDSIIGDRGQKLSGGERQRISIARAFLTNAPILILDEATSSLDNESEKAVQTALEELMQNRTTLVIAHRLSTIRNSDQIIVMKEGRILESGRHEDLLSLDGEYARFQKLGTDVPSVL